MSRSQITFASLLTLACALVFGCDGDETETTAGMSAPGGMMAPAGMSTPGGVGEPGGVQTPGGVQMPGGVEMPGGVGAPGGMGMPGGADMPGGMGMPGGADMPGGMGMPGGTDMPAGAEQPGGVEGGAEGGTPAAQGACTNPSDLSQFESLGEEGINEAVQMCVFTMPCLNVANQAPECGACIAEASNLSTECSACFVEVIACTLQYCIANCFDPESAACAECRETNCNPIFDSCAGELMP